MPAIAVLTALLSASASHVLSRPTLWTLQADGRTCAELSTEARELFRGWRIDPDNTVEDAEVWGLFNPASPNQLVVLYGSRATCQNISGELQRESPLPPQIAWGKAKDGLRVGIAVADVRWRSPDDRAVLLRVQRTGKRAVTLDTPATGKKGNVVVRLDGEPLTKQALRRHGSKRTVTLGPGQVESFTLKLTDEQFPSGRHELTLTYAGRTSGPIEILVD